MTHPTDLLTDYVDGTLPPEQRAGVDAHLATCDTCRSEVELARTAKTALAGLPELDAPVGIPARVERAAATAPRSSGVSSGAGSRSSGIPMTYRVIAGLAAAALVGLFAFSMLRESTGPSSLMSADSEAASGGGPADAPQTAAPASDPKDGDFTGEELQALAEREVAFAKGPARDTRTVEENLAAEDEKWLTPGGTDDNMYSAFEVQGAAGKAGRCLRKAGAFESGGTLVRAFQAKLTGIPAYFGVLRTGEAPGDPVDRIVIWVAAKDGCDVIGFTQAYIVRPSPSPFPEELEGITPPPGL